MPMSKRAKYSNIEYEDDANKFILRQAYDTTALVDETYCADKFEFFSLMSGSSYVPNTYQNDASLGIDTINTLTDNGSNPNVLIKARYPNYDTAAYPELHILTDEAELTALKAQYPQFSLDILHTNGENLLNEINLAEWIKSLPIQNYNVWVCGPAGIISATEKACHIVGLAPEKFHREYFTAKSVEDMQAASVGDATDAPLSPGEVAEVEIKYDGKKLKYTCQYNETILDAALNAGGDPPYSCLVAACSTCRAMVKTGNIEMKDRDALSDKDIAKGFVLTCQSMPRSKKIILDYDV
jgi:ferredoxin